VSGQHPQTGAIIDTWDCAIAWIPVLLIENSKQQHQTSAAVESFRNEVVKGNDAFVGMLSMAAEKNSVRKIGNGDAMERD
jgi:hypothetical protein